MKKLTCLIVVLILGFSNRSFAQAEELAQLLLDIEKLAQFKQILSDLKKGYEILNGGYNTIKNISEGNFSLHKTFLDGLMAVSPAVKKYKRIADIVNDQIILVKEYKTAFNRFKSSQSFTTDEISYIGGVYHRLFSASLEHLDELTTVITAGKLRMSDDERLKVIDRIYDNMEDKLQFLRQFNNTATTLALQRMKTQSDVNAVQKMHGITN
jgi:DNA repair ATPase RecN